MTGRRKSNFSLRADGPEGRHLTTHSWKRYLSGGALFAGLTLGSIPSPASAFVCEEVGGGGGFAGASPTGMACGFVALAPGDIATAVGNGSQAAGSDSVALGWGAHADFNNSIAIGANVKATRAGQVAIGWEVNTYTLAGINSFESKNAQGGTKYLVTSDAAGNLATASVNIDEIEGLADDVAAHTTQIASLNTTVSGHTTQLADHETRITNNTNQINTLNTTVGNHTAQLADHETRITDNTNTLNLHTAQIFSLDSRTTINEANIALLDGRVGALEGGLQDLGEQVSENRSEARAGTALALATAGLRYDDRPGKLSLAGGFGHFKGQSGLALGLGYNPSLDFRLNAAVSASTNRGDVGVSVGASWTLN